MSLQVRVVRSENWSLEGVCPKMSVCDGEKDP